MTQQCTYWTHMCQKSYSQHLCASVLSFQAYPVHIYYHCLPSNRISMAGIKLLCLILSQAFLVLDLYFKKNTFFTFIVFRERECMKEERGRGKERENLKQAPCSVRSPTRGLIPRLWEHDLNRNQESNTQLTEPPRHPSPLHF